MGVSYPLACNLPVAELNWKAVCVERRTYRLEGGKGREALPILTLCENLSLDTFVLIFAQNGTKKQRKLVSGSEFRVLTASFLRMSGRKRADLIPLMPVIRSLAPRNENKRTL